MTEVINLTIRAYHDTPPIFLLGKRLPLLRKKKKNVMREQNVGTA